MEGKNFLGTYGEKCLHESMSYVFDRVFPNRSMVAMLHVSLIKGSPFAMASAWALVIRAIVGF